MADIHERELPEWPEAFTARTVHFVCLAVGGLTARDFAVSTIGKMDQEREVCPSSKRGHLDGAIGTFWPRFHLTDRAPIQMGLRNCFIGMDRFLRACSTDVAPTKRE